MRLIAVDQTDISRILDKIFTIDSDDSFSGFGVQEEEAVVAEAVYFIWNITEKMPDTKGKIKKSGIRFSGV